jgi:hypothetical protein
LAAVSLLLTNAAPPTSEAGTRLVDRASASSACKTHRSRRILAWAESAETESSTAVAEDESRVEGSGVLLASSKQ